MGVDGVGEEVERVLQHQLRAPADEALDDVGVLEQAVDRGRQHPAGRPHRAAADVVVTRRPPGPDLVAPRHDAAQRGPRRRQVRRERDLAMRRHLVRGEDGVERQHPQSGVATRAAALDTGGVVDRAAEQLAPAADPEQACRRREDGAVEAPRAQPRQVGRHVLGAREDDEIGAVEVGRVLRERHPGGAGEQVQLVEVGAEREAQHDDALGAWAGVGAHRGTLLVGQLVVQHRHDAGARHPGELGELRRPGREQRRIAPEAVQHESGEALARRGRDERPRAVQVGEGAAAVDVGDEQGRGVGVLEHPVVDEVGEVDLGRAPRPLQHDELVLGAQRLERRRHRRPQRRAAVTPGQRRQLGRRPAGHDDLGARVGLRLEQHRVHPHVGLDAGRTRLQPLGDADLPAVDDAGVVRHVLGLERRHVDALAGEPPAQRGDEPALPGARRAAEHHQRAHQVPKPNPRSGAVSSGR